MVHLLCTLINMITRSTLGREPWNMSEWFSDVLLCLISKVDLERTVYVIDVVCNMQRIHTVYFRLIYCLHQTRKTIMYIRILMRSFRRGTTEVRTGHVVVGTRCCTRNWEN